MLYLLHTHWLWFFGALVIGIIVGWLTYFRAATRWADRPVHIAVAIVAVGAIVAGARIVPGRYGYWLELGVILAVFYAIGCCIGWALRDLAEFTPAVARRGAAATAATTGSYLFRDAFAGTGAGPAYMRTAADGAAPRAPLPTGTALPLAPAPGGYTFPRTLPFADVPARPRATPATGLRPHWSSPRAAGTADVPVAPAFTGTKGGYIFPIAAAAALAGPTRAGTTRAGMYRHWSWRGATSADAPAAAAAPAATGPAQSLAPVVATAPASSPRADLAEPAPGTSATPPAAALPSSAGSSPADVEARAIGGTPMTEARPAGGVSSATPVTANVPAIAASPASAGMTPDATATSPTSGPSGAGPGSPMAATDPDAASAVSPAARQPAIGDGSPAAATGPGMPGPGRAAVPAAGVGEEMSSASVTPASARPRSTPALATSEAAATTSERSTQAGPIVGGPTTEMRPAEVEAPLGTSGPTAPIPAAPTEAPPASAEDAGGMAASPSPTLAPASPGTPASVGAPIAPPTATTTAGLPSAPPSAPGQPATIAAVPGEEKHAGARPEGLMTARDNRADDLKRIRGIGPQNEGRLHGLGIWHFDQIAGWTPENVRWVGSYLAFPGRIDREGWLEQARALAGGGDTDVSKRMRAGKVATSRDDGSQGQLNIDPNLPPRPRKPPR